MREGFNPNKNIKIEENTFFHQVIIPVYIPYEEKYFKDSLIILKYSLNSLFKTSHKHTFFTIVNNGSCKKVIEYLNDLLINKKIHELIHTNNIGKLNAITKGTSGQNFPIITISDADVLFLNNWQKETYKIFNAFPKTGVVSTTPNSKLLKYNTANIILANLFSKQMRFSKVKDEESMKMFGKSIGNEKLFNKYHLDQYLTINKKYAFAVVGAGHFVGTYNAIVLDKTNYSNYKMGVSIRNFLDKPIFDKGFWRLSTVNNFTYHMGNTIEPWMGDVVTSLSNETDVFKAPVIESRIKSINYVSILMSFMFSKLIYRKNVWHFFLRFKGLTNEASKKY